MTMITQVRNVSLIVLSWVLVLIFCIQVQVHAMESIPMAEWKERLTSNTAILRKSGQVLQRDENCGDCFIKLGGEFSPPVEVWIGHSEEGMLRSDEETTGTATSESGVLVTYLFKGRPYTIEVRSKNKNVPPLVFHNILVGDLWLLAGQSNMQGMFAPIEKLPISPQIHMLDRPTGHWMPADDPVHHLVGDYARQILPMYQNIDLKDLDGIEKSGVPMGGVNAANFFAHEMVKETGVPIGLIPCASGEPSLDAWTPGNPNDGGLYQFMLDRVEQCGGRVRGMLWYQGESDCKPETAATYGARFTAWVERLRKDLNDPALPIFTAQLCRGLEVDATSNRLWEQVREAQRQCADTIPNVYMAATVDLDLGNGVHIDQAAQKIGGALGLASAAACEGRRGVAAGD